MVRQSSEEGTYLRCRFVPCNFTSEKGLADDLGSGVYKKRLNDNMHRSIILTQSGQGWVYQYLFAKKDRSNIDSDELLQFRALAKAYAKLTTLQLEQLIKDQAFLEICHDQN